jgi:hypothetical protein
VPMGVEVERLDSRILPFRKPSLNHMPTGDSHRAPITPCANRACLSSAATLFFTFEDIPLLVEFAQRIRRDMAAETAEKLTH